MGSQRMIRVLTVDDHPLLRGGISGAINAQPDMTVVAEATDGDEAVACFRAHQPDITLMDLRMPKANGIDAITAIRKEWPTARLIVLTTYGGDGSSRCGQDCFRSQRSPQLWPISNRICLGDPQRHHFLDEMKFATSELSPPSGHANPSAGGSGFLAHATGLAGVT